MPSLDQHQSNETTKLLLLGNSGSGKTGALASLAKAGYNLRILDIDNGVDVLVDLLLRKDSTYGPEAAGRVRYVTLTDPTKPVGGRLVPSKATVWQRLSGMLGDWKEFKKDKDGKDVLGPDGKKVVEADLGPITSWTSQEVLVIDSLSMLGTAAMNYGMALNGKLGTKPGWPEFADGQAILEPLLQSVYADEVKCNVIINTHLHDLARANEARALFPNTGTGRALEPKVGRYFNSILLAKKTGMSGQRPVHKIFTTTTEPVDLKTPAPGRVKNDYPLESGLADFFADLRKRG